MSIIAKLFGSDNVINTLTEGFYNGIDKSVLTAQEQIELKQKAIALYEPFKIAQRLIALTFCVPYVAAWTITFLMAAGGLDTTSETAMLDGIIGQIVLAIVAFYFLGGTISGFRGK